MSAHLRMQDRQITVANRFIYYYASFIKGIYGFVLRREGKNIPDKRHVGQMKASRDETPVAQPAIDEIVLFRYRKRLMLGYCRRILDRRGDPAIQVVAEDRRRLRLHRHDLVRLTGLSVAEDRGFLRTYASSVRELSDRIDLREVWELLGEVREALPIREIAELYWEDEMDASRWVALYLHLEHTCPYFEPHGPDRYIPLSGDGVAARQCQQERIESLGHEWDEFIHWLAAGKEEPYDPETLTKRHRAWLEGVRQYALRGTEAQNWKQTREILSEISPEAGNRQQLAFRLLVRKGIWENEEDLALERAGISARFPAEALRMADGIDIDRVLAGRKKMRRHIFLIGGEDRHDPELGISLRRRWWRWDYELGIHFPDVASLVPAGSALDRCASDRMAALRLPDRYLPMLPPRISEELALLGAAAVGEYCVTRGLPAVFEAQEDPADRAILEKIPSPIVRRHEIGRQTPPVALSANPGSHHGLGISGLACVASPLQRYPDLMVQRQVLHHLLCGETMYREEDIRPIRYRAQEELREMDALRHRRERHWLLKHLSSSLGQPLSAVVLHLRRDGTLVELLDYPLKVVVRPNRPVSVGDEVQIRLYGVDLWKSEAHGSIV